MFNQNKLVNLLIYFILIVTPLLFFTDLTRNPYYTQISLLHASMLVILLVYIFGGIRSGKILLPKTPLDAPLLSFLAVAVISLVVSFIKHPVEYFRYALFSEGLNRLFFTVVNCALVFYAAFFYVNKHNRKRVLAISVVVGGVAAFYGVLQYFGIEFIWPKNINPFGVRSVSTFGNPNFLSSYIVMLLPLGLAFYLLSKNKAGKFFYLGCSLIYAASLVATLTRSSWVGALLAIGLLAAALYFFSGDYFKKNIFSIGLFIALIIAVVVFWPKGNSTGYDPGIKERIFEIANAGKEVYHPVHQRLLIWKSSWNMLESHPLLGVGWGAMELFYPFYQGRLLYDGIFSQLRTHANNSHNEILEILSQLGLVGFGVYLWFIAALFYLIYKTLKHFKNKNRDDYIVAAALGAALAGMLADNLLNVSVHFAVPAFLYWWFIGIAAGYGKDEGVEEKYSIVLNTRAPKIKLPLILISAAVILLLVRTYKFQLNQVYFFKGFKISQSAKPDGNNGALIRALKASENFLVKAHSARRLEVNNNYELGNVYARLKNHEKAIWAYEEALRANSGYDEIYYNLGSIYYQKGEHAKAVEYFKISNFINPLYKESYTGLSNIYIMNIQQGKDAAENRRDLEELFLNGLRVFPEERDFWNNLGYVYMSTERYKEAVKAYEKALVIDPAFQGGKDNMLFCLKKLNIKSHPLLEVDTKLSLAVGYINKGEAGKAADLINDVLAASPNNAVALMYMGNISVNGKEYEKAVDYYNKALKIDPNNLGVLSNIGVTYIFLKEYEKARQAYSKVAELTRGKQNFVNNYNDAVKKLEDLKKY